ncbi:MAG TPA: hypothetical protein VL092_01515 [Chitinophagaceae bacterium]|nr:hypothetical protein [Chitinophagaceae bacterium]HTN16329.1 hypothetical protein [Chitinophagaceae bacterium]
MKKTFILLTTVLASVFGNEVKAQDAEKEIVKVYRWYNPTDANYITVADGEHQDGQLLNWHYKDKTLMFFAYRNPAADRVAVNSWYNPNTKDFASIAEDEFTDDQMLKMGYTDKHLQFYATTRRGANQVAVYRWFNPKRKDWVTIPEEGDTDAYFKKGYRHKAFQYYGISRGSDVMIYNQL